MYETLTVDEAAPFLRVSTDKIYDMVQKKELPHFRIGRRIFFYRSYLQKWIERQSTMQMS